MPFRVIDRVDDLDFAVASLPVRPAAVGVLLAEPTYFDVLYVINPHMAGNVGQVDTERARAQWEALRQAYLDLGYPVHVLAAAPGLPDLVFMANQSFPTQMPDGRWVAVMSRMHFDHRRGEVGLVEAWYRGRNAQTLHLGDQDLYFEGMGDARWHPGRMLIYGGYGFRTARAVYDELAPLVEVPVVALRLVDEDFYHLDTCLSPLDEQTALYIPEAFDAAGRALLQRLFPRLIEADPEEARHNFACNGNCPDGRHYLVQAGSERTMARVREAGFEVVELDTSEFLKSGGSVFCMTMMIP